MLKKRVFTVFILIQCCLSSSEMAIPGLNQNFFSLDELPSDGKIEIKVGDKTESLELGKNKSQYAMGLFFSKKHLPEKFFKSLGDRQALQIAFGNRGSSSGEFMSQFGSLHIKLNRFPTATPSRIKMHDTLQHKREKSDSAFLIFNSSQSRFTAEEQEKLKTTFFSESGDITLNTSEAPQSVWVKHDGQRLAFKRQLLQVTLVATLGTPFNHEKGQVTGTFKTPVYWPASPEASAWMNKLTQSQLERAPEITPPEQAPRSLASPEDPQRAKRISTE